MQTVLVLFGGRSAEHEISVLSARFIVRSLDRSRYQPLLVGIAPSGRWQLIEERQLPEGDDPRQVTLAEDAGPLAWLLPMPAGRDDGRCALHVEGRAPLLFDVAFPILHGPMGEDGCTQGLCELAAVPYVGAGVASSAAAMDKVLQKQLFERAELPQLPYRVGLRHQHDAAPDELLARCEELPYPLFVKPANMGSSLGVTRAADRAELRAALAEAFELDRKLVIEAGLQAPREIELSVLGNEQPEASVAGEIVVQHADGFYSYAAKYIDADGAKLLVPAPLSDAQLSALQLLALRAYRTLDCAGMARVDLFLDADGQPYLNEVNTIPGFTAISMYPQLWKASGLAAQPLVTRLIELALERGSQRAALRTRR